MTMQSIKKHFNFLLVFLIPLLLTLLWFRRGLVYGGGESGLYFYDLARSAQITQFAWAEAALGNITGVGVSGHFMHALFAYLVSFGVPVFFVQAVFYFALLVIPGLSIWFLTKLIFPKISKSYYLLAVLFYWFNPISLINVWNRNLDNYRVFYAILPLVFLLFLFGIKTRRMYFGIVTSLATGVFAYALSATPFHILLWLVIVYVIVFNFMFARSNKDRVWLIGYFLTTLISFSLINFWWLTSFFSFIFSPSFTDSVTSFFSVGGNVNTLGILSEKLGMSQDVMRLVHGTFFETGPAWGRIYDTAFAKGINFLLVLPIFYAVYRGYKVKNIFLLGLFFVLSIFLVKGDAMPLGEIFDFVFVKFTFFQVFRNPFEKFSFIVPLVAAPLFAFGVSEIATRFSKVRQLVNYVYFAGVVVFLGLPFFTGFVFLRVVSSDTKQMVSVETEVPAYYKEANTWLKDQGENFRLLVLPINGEGADYTWEVPYAGVELSSTLFERSNISFSTTVPFFENIANNIERLLLTREGTKNLFSILNVDYIVVRADVDYRVREMRDPAKIKTVLDSTPYLKHEKDFGPLSVYSLDPALRGRKIYATGSGIQVTPQATISDFVMAEGASTDFIFGKNNAGVPASRIFIKPWSGTRMTAHKKLSPEEAMAQLLHVSHLPGSFTYNLVLFKENLEKLTMEAQSDKFIFDLTRLGKRSVEVYKLAEANTDKATLVSSIERYKDLFKNIELENPGGFVSNPANPYKDIISTELGKHLTLFEVKESMGDEVKNEMRLVYEYLKNKLSTYGILTQHEVRLAREDSRELLVYEIDVEQSGEYELFIEDSRNDLYFEDSDKEVEIQIDGNVYKSLPVITEGKVRLGKYKLESGAHELFFEVPRAKNLVPEMPEFVVDSDDSSEVLIDMRDFDPFANYQVTFDYFVEKGLVLEFFFRQDNDPLGERSISSPYRREIVKDRYASGYQSTSFTLYPKRGGEEGKIALVAKSYNDCPVDKKRLFILSSCEDKEYRRIFDKKTRVFVKNFKVEKIFNENVYLESSSKPEAAQPIATSYTKLNPTEYEVAISGAKTPTTLIFSELFNYDWELIREDGSVVDSTHHFVANTYANGWYIEEPRDEKMKIVFKGQKMLEKSYKVSVVSFVAFSVLTVVARLGERKRKNV